MSQHVELNYQSQAHEGFFDPIQEQLSGSAPHFRVVVVGATTIQVLAGTGHDQQSVSIQGKYRYRTTNTSVATHPGGAAGTHAVYVTGSDNAFTGPPTAIDQTVHDFGLEVRTSGTPATAIYRQVAEVDWDGSKITALRHLAGDRRDDGPIMPTAPIAGFTPIQVKAAAAQTAPLVLLRDSTGVALGGWGPGGEALIGTTTVTGKINLASATTAAGGIAFGTDTNLYRSAANKLKTDDDFILGADLWSGNTTTNDVITPDFRYQNAFAKLYVKGLILADIGDTPDLGLRRVGPDGGAPNATPAALGAGETIARIYFQAYGTNGDFDTPSAGQHQGAWIGGKTTEIPTGTNRGTEMTIATTPDGSDVNADAITVRGTGGLTLHRGALDFQNTVGSGYVELREQTVEPGSPAADRMRFFAMDNGGKTTFYAKFATGSKVAIAAQP